MSSTIKHDPNLPWGWWMRTVEHPRRGLVIVDEHGREWRSLRDAFWSGRLSMIRDNPRIMEENLELLLALLASRSRGVVAPLENLHGLHDGSVRFYRWWTYWLLSTKLVEIRVGNSPFDAVPTAEGTSVIRMLMATRPPHLAAVPIGPAAMATFGAPGTETECSRVRFADPRDGALSYPAAMVREELFKRPAISLLHRNIKDKVPFARTIWSMSFFDEPSRDRMYGWMHDRLDRWTARSEIVIREGADALTQHVLALVALTGELGSGPINIGSASRPPLPPPFPDPGKQP